MSSAAGVYKGRWTDREHGSVLGMRVTLSSSSGQILLAAIALFVGICGLQSWSVCRLVLHQMRPKDKAGHEHPEVAGSGGTSYAIPASGHTVSANRDKSHSQSPVSQPWAISIILIALLNLSLWPIAALFSSQIARADYPVLVSSPNCGHYIDMDINSTDEYIQTCHSFSQTAGQNDSTSYSNSPLCRQFTTVMVPWQSDTNASCPFEQKMCLIGAAFGMDTGYLDSHDVFGINTPPDQRILYRRKTVCSPLIEDEPGHVGRRRGIEPGEEMILYYYGGDDSTIEVTFRVSTYAQRSPSGYTIRSKSGLENLKPELARPDADVALFLVVPGQIGYLGPVNDPVFSANRPAGTTGDAATVYLPDSIASVVACADQHQICNHPNPGPEGIMRCTPFNSRAGIMRLYPTMADIGLNDMQRGITYTFLHTIRATDMSYSVAGRDAESLLASRTLFDGVNVQLPDNQWTAEVSNWFSIGMVRLQLALLEYVTGPAADLIHRDEQEMDGSATLTRLDGLERIYENTCLLQKVGQFHLGEDYLTFNVLGLVLIVALGGLIVVSGLMLEVLVERLPRRGWGWKKREVWIQQDRLVTWRKLKEQKRTAWGIKVSSWSEESKGWLKES
ncbi:hypothetical protein QBC37DRAFT_296323 [Rhypophila decipiens]|uniref:Uncharacterized protein n=1 Tax=Rhypophila decipiens TaxID=261697 RepID=A0AAN6XZU2_9PEZI|nr:hypothetical protein QBC37DRAFT_296323 [Rhypophila decipiens]